MQSLLHVLIGRLAFLPAAVFLLVKIGDAYATKTGLKTDVYKQGLINQKFSAQLPDAHGDFGSEAARDDICVLLIGARNNE